MLRFILWLWLRLRELPSFLIGLKKTFTLLLIFPVKYIFLFYLPLINEFFKSGSKFSFSCYLLLLWFLYVWKVFLRIYSTLDFALIILLPIRSFYNAKLNSFSYYFIPLIFLFDPIWRYLNFAIRLIDNLFGLLSCLRLTSRLLIWFYLLKIVLLGDFIALASGRGGVFWKFYVMSLSLLGFMILWTRSWLVILYWYSSVMWGSIFLTDLCWWWSDFDTLEEWCWL